MIRTPTKGESPGRSPQTAPTGVDHAEERVVDASDSTYVLPAAAPHSLGANPKTRAVTRLQKARGMVIKAKTALKNSRNLKTELKEDITQAVDALYGLVREFEQDKQTTQTAIEVAQTLTPTASIPDELLSKIEENNRLLKEHSLKLEALKESMEEQKGLIKTVTYASVTAGPQNAERQRQQHKALHTIAVASIDEKSTGDETYEEIRKAI
ncbi:unnamed protein product [Danaus chrysippus]|uniref:(African queen) hypothetical protein n=1 Tax=Danaus chrysippus TaxID=151541 RepID=A0A8J2VWB1_9NEOP|nr:unnamed protein product [Danaus chrysippus]